MKIFVPFVRVTVVEGKTVHDICFVDTTDRKHAIEQCKTAGMKVIASATKTYKAEIAYEDSTSEVVFLETCDAAECDMAWDDIETKFKPVKGGVDND